VAIQKQKENYGRKKVRSLKGENGRPGKLKGGKNWVREKKYRCNFKTQGGSSEGHRRRSLSQNERGRRVARGNSKFGSRGDLFNWKSESAAWWIQKGVKKKDNGG